MKRGLVILFELVLVGIAIVIADAIQDQFNAIPRAIVRLPSVDYTRGDFWQVFRYFIVIHLFVFALVQWRIAEWKFSDGKRTAEELFALAAGFAISALAVFVTTTVAFDPNFIALIAIISAVLFVLTFLVAVIVSGNTSAAAFMALPKGLLRRTFSVVGIVTLLLAISPAILAKLFVSDRDIANKITQIRIYFGGSTDVQYSLLNALGGQTFSQPILVRNDPANAGRLMILERAGRLLSVDYPSGENVTVELDVHDKVGTADVENGALGFDFHPGYGQAASANRSFIYMYYTDVRDGRQINRLSRFDLGLDDIAARSSSELPLMVLPREASGFHNGGSVDFGNDGFLYIALGEGVRPKGLRSQAQTLRSGIVRIDVDRRGGEISHPIKRSPAQGVTENYFIPDDNPFVGNPEILEEYWAIGLRNPFRISFDAETQALWAGDVGSTEWEEVNIIKKGGHYEFPFMQGYKTTTDPRPESVLGEEYPPLYAYVHTAFDRAVIGGVVYRGDRMPELNGKYVFADNYSSKIFVMPGDGQRVSDVETIAQADQYAQRGISSVAQLDDGSIVATTLGKSGAATGEVLTLVEGIVEDSEARAAARNGDQSEPVTKADADAIYNANCSRCHGSDGAADGPDAAILNVAIAHFNDSEFQETRSDAHLGKVIRDGGLAMGLDPLMPPWGHLLSDKEIDALVMKIRDFSPQE